MVKTLMDDVSNAKRTTNLLQNKLYSTNVIIDKAEDSIVNLQRNLNKLQK